MKDWNYVPSNNAYKIVGRSLLRIPFFILSSVFARVLAKIEIVKCPYTVRLMWITELFWFFSKVYTFSSAYHCHCSFPLCNLTTRQRVHLCVCQTEKFFRFFLHIPCTQKNVTCIRCIAVIVYVWKFPLSLFLFFVSLSNYLLSFNIFPLCHIPSTTHTFRIHCIKTSWIDW